MRVLPILFNTDMVRAILGGRKTVTRRVVKFPVNKFTNKIPTANNVTVYQNMMRSEKVNFSEKPFYCFDVKPPCQPGDILYVRETWQYMYDLDGNDQIIENTGRYIYASDGFDVDTWVNSDGTHRYGIPWKPSIHMPKAAARIWLKVTDVRVERLQDMYVDDAIKEGAWGNGKPNIPFSILGEKYPNACNATASFAHLWDSTIKKTDLNRYGWDANPWAWVIEFERCEKPEPCIIAGVEPAESKRPYIGYSRSDTDDEPCEMCKACTRRDGYDSEED